MAAVIITSARIQGPYVVINGTVDGRGHVVSVPKANIDAVSGKANKVQVAALALKARDDEEGGTGIDLIASVTV